MTSSSRVTDYTEVIETETMARLVNAADSRPVMIQVRVCEGSVSPPWRSAARIGRRLLACAAGQPWRHGIACPADPPRRQGRGFHRDRLGTFEIRAAADRVPGSLMNFNPMPRVIVDYDAVEAAGLTGFGSRVRYLWLYKTRDGEEVAFAQEVGREFRRIKLGIPVGVGTFRYIEDWLNASLANFEGFTGLIGVAILVLGGIGIASVTRVFVQQKLKTIAILKCLGGRNVRVLGAYLTQTVALGLGGSLLGLVFAYLVSVCRRSAHVEPLSPLSLRARDSTVRASGRGRRRRYAHHGHVLVAGAVEIRRTKPNVLLRRDLGAAGLRLGSTDAPACSSPGRSPDSRGFGRRAGYPGTRRLIGGSRGDGAGARMWLAPG